MNFSEGGLLDVVTRGSAKLFEMKASDIRIQSDDYIFAYINRTWVRQSDRRLDDGELNLLVNYFYKSQSGLGVLGNGKPLDFELTLQPDPNNPDELLRCRANVTRSRVGNVANGLSVVLRTIPGLPPRWKEDLNIEDPITEAFFPSNGLVLVIGVTGSGKSTMLASSIRYRIETMQIPVAIGSYEQPIEYIFPRLPGGLMPEVSQVQLGSHLADFEDASPNVLRRKFDVVLVGEMRDRKSVEAGLLISDTGHATYGTLHSETPATALPRIINEFPIEAQPAIANKLLDNTRMVVAQKIERSLAGSGYAVRSWCEFDRSLKRELREHEYAKWSGLILARMERDKTTFEHRAYPALRDGIIDFETFKKFASMNSREARDFIERQEQTQEPLDEVQP